MTATQSAAQTDTAIRLDRDDALCLRVVGRDVQAFTGMHQVDGQHTPTWGSTGHSEVETCISRLEAKGEGFARYYLIDEDGNATKLGV